jgi:putative ABC transport system permease protein
MMVMSIRDSAQYTVNDMMFKILDGDISLVFDAPERIEHIEELALKHPEVSAVESWEFLGAGIRPAGQTETEDDETAQIFGVPLPSIMYGYQLRGGRWLDPTDTYAIVLNTKLAEEVGVGVGDWVTIKYAEFNERDWQVVGLVFDPIFITSSIVPRDILLDDLNHPGRVQSVWLNTHNQDPEAQIEIAKALRAYFDQNNVKMSPVRGVFGGFGGEATVQIARAIVNQFNFIIVLAGIMAIIIAIVGSIALSGTISLSVMERTREIGVMRAIGASNWTVARLFIGEGLILGWLSWLIALPFSQPGGRLMMSSLSAAFQQEYIYKYTPTGALLWLAIITVLSILASWLPARSATRVSVRQSLVYQ